MANLDLQEPRDFMPQATGEDSDEMQDDVDVVGKEKTLTEDGGVTKTILVPGEGWESPETGDSVSVHYVGTLEDGTPFDSSRDRGTPFEFTLGKGQVIKGWDAGVAAMKKGEKAVLKCRADYAYGKSGSPPKIPADATLLFEVELLSWKSTKDLLGDGGVIKDSVQEGTGWDNPKDQDEILVKYSVTLAGQKEPCMQSAEGGEEFTLKAGHQLPGITEAVRTMKKGEKALLKLAPSYGFGAEGSEAHGVPPNAALEVDVEVVGWKKVERVTDDGLVVKKTLAESAEWARPNEGARVTVRVGGRVEGGEVFEEERELEFVTDEDAVVEGLELAVRKMKKGERALVSVAPKYGYGGEEHRGPAGTVPPGSTLVYDVELLDFKNAKESWDLKGAEKVEAAEARKERGNAAYKGGRLERAVRLYEKAIELLSSDSDLGEELKASCRGVRKSCWLNLAAVQLKRREWREVAKNCDKVLEVDPTNVKALYRRAQSYIGSMDYLEAELDLKRGLEADPQNTDLSAALKRLKALQRVQNKQESQLYGRMFKALGGGGKGVAAGGAAADGGAVHAKGEDGVAAA